MEFVLLMQLTEEAITPSFSGHETFTLRYGWLKKAVYGVDQDSQLFSRPDAMVILGVGKNMVRSMRHWATSLQVVEEDSSIPNNRGRHLKISEFGRLMFGDNGIDPYLEHTGTIWILHYLLASRPESPTTWYWCFNHLSDLEFTSDGLIAELGQLAERHDWNRIAATTLERDVTCFIRTYIPPKRSRTVGAEDTLDCPFNELELLHSLDSVGAYAFARGEQRSLTHEAFAFALLRFWEQTAPNRNALNSADMTYEPGSPGKVFKLTESAVVDHMREMDKVTRKSLVFNSTAGLVQLYRRREINPLDVLRPRWPRRSK